MTTRIIRSSTKERHDSSPKSIHCYSKFLAVLPGCSPSCGPNAFCQDSDGFPKCVCNAGFQGDGFNCIGKFYTAI